MRLKLSVALILILIASLGVSLWQWLMVDLPHPGQLYQHASAPSTNIFDRHGNLLYQITDPHQGSHTPLTLDEIPPACVQATIATEDASFYSNPGFDTKAMLRALYTNLRKGGVVSGASTITQQLARNLMFTEAERTEISLTRKLREIILAWRLTQNFSKDEILTLYLNETYYGNLAYGLEAAAAAYFGKPAAALDLAECALLAGLPQSPVYYNPLENLPAAEARQADVLGLMVKHGYLPESEARLAQTEKLRFSAIPFPIQAPHFVMHIRNQLERQFGLEAIYTQGLQVYTTLDLNMQNTAQQITQYHLAELEKPQNGLPPHNVRNAAVVILSPKGEVLTMLGSPNYFDRRIDGNVNAAVALRQPGSSIKPLTYAAAFDPGLAKRFGYQPLTPASMMLDVRTSFVTKEGDPYVPQNYDRKWRGPVLLRPALAQSMNLIAVKVLNHVGLEAMTSLSRQLGITTFDDADRFGLALTLGGGEVRLLELTAAYAAFNNGGRKVEPFSISKVSAANGDILYQRQLAPGDEIISPQTAYLITDILSDNLARAGAFGEGSPLRLSRPSAAKTGTTTDFRDNWTIGYTPDFITGVWAGNADNEPMRNVSGISGAAPIWHDIMEAIHKGQPVRSFARPAGLTVETVCAVNGLLPSAGCPRTLNETFIAGTEPTIPDTWHKQLAIDRRNGLLASPSCPPEETVRRWFTVYPLSAQPWAEKSATRLAPDAYSPLCNEDNLRAGAHAVTLNEPALQLISPDQGTTYHIAPSIPLDKQKIKISALVSPQIEADSVRLLVNGQPLAQSNEALWQLTPGTYRFEALGLDAEGKLLRDGVEIVVRE